MLPYFIVYIFLSISFSIYSRRFAKNVRDYTISPSSFNIFLSASSQLSCLIGGFTMIGLAPRFLISGFNNTGADPFATSCTSIIISIFFVNVYYKYNVITINEIYEKLYDKRVSQMLSTVASITSVLFLLVQFASMSMALMVIFDNSISKETSIIISMLLIFGYTYFGGIWSLVVADAMQFIFLTMAAVVICVYTTMKAGGLVHVVSHAYNHGYISIYKPNSTKTHDILLFIVGIIYNMGGIPMQNTYSRIRSSANIRTAKISFAITSILYLVISIMCILAGYALVVNSPEIHSSIVQNNRLYLQYLTKDIPDLVKVIFMIGLFSAISSTASAIVLNQAPVFVKIILNSVFKKEVSDSTLWKLIKITMISMILIMGIASDTNNSSLFTLLIFCFQSAVSVIFPVFLLGVYWKKVNPDVAAVSIICSIISTIILFSIMHNQVSSVLSGLLNCSILIIGSLIFPKKTVNTEDKIAA